MISFATLLLLSPPPLPLGVPAEFQGVFASNPAACGDTGAGTRILVTDDSWSLGDAVHPIIGAIRVSPEVFIIRYERVVALRTEPHNGEISDPVLQGAAVEMVALIANAPGQLRVLFETHEGIPEPILGGLSVTRCEK